DLSGFESGDLWGSAGGGGLGDHSDAREQSIRRGQAPGSSDGLYLPRVLWNQGLGRNALQPRKPSAEPALRDPKNYDGGGMYRHEERGAADRRAWTPTRGQRSLATREHRSPSRLGVRSRVRGRHV